MAEVDDGGFIRRFVRIADFDGQRVFARFGGEALSFGYLHEQSDRIAAGLRRAGVERGGGGARGGRGGGRGAPAPPAPPPRSRASVRPGGGGGGGGAAERAAAR